MERCPNCGAPARPGAKFCTTCGYRLPAVAPNDTPSETGGAAPSDAGSSWPPPPVAASTDSSPSSPDEPGDTERGSDEVIAMPAPTTDADTGTSAEASTTAGSDSDDARTDSVVSSSWPSPATTASDPWSTTNDYSGGASADESGEAVTVTEEVVIVPAPASQYEGWSASVVEEVAPATGARGGTTIARAMALVDELRELLPALNAGAARGENDDIFAELEAIITEGNQNAADRQALREALYEARDNPRDIQTILALSQQADAAIALLDEHDRLVSTVQRALASRGTQASDDAE